MSRFLCIYHGNCADGFGAAYAVWRWDSSVEFHAGVYGQPPPDVAGKHVILVDFTYPLDVLRQMAKGAAKSITILDHHKTAAEILQRFVRQGYDFSWDFDEFSAFCETSGEIPIRAIFDMNRSGAMLAWDFFHPGVAAPRLFAHIQDRDLWQFKLPGTRPIQANLFSYPYDFTVWDAIVEACEDDEYRAKFIAEGDAIERKHFKDLAELSVVTLQRMVIGGYDVPVCNLPYTMSSDAGHQLAQGEPFAACFWITADGWVFSLRSAEGGVDVSEVAKRYGGGGHKNAAGFRVPSVEALPNPLPVCTPVLE